MTRLKTISKLFLLCTIVVCSTTSTSCRSKIKVTIHGNSMEPTYKDGEIIFMQLYDNNDLSIERGDILLAKSPDNKIILKRCIAIPLDTIYMKAGFYYINSKKSNLFIDSFEKNTNLKELQIITDFSPLIIPHNNYYLSGDNVLFSHDSRHFGTIHENNIIGIIKNK